MHCFKALASGKPPSLRRSHTRTQSEFGDFFTRTWKVPGINEGLRTTELMCDSSKVEAFDVNVCNSSC